MKTFRSIIRILSHTLAYIMVGGFLVTGALRIGMLLFARTRTYLPEKAPKAPVALVLGAGLNRDGTPGVVLQDRVRTATELYFDGRVEKLLMSGDNVSEYYDEPGSMKEFALSLGVPEEDIILDFAGQRTYDSCFRARAIFGLDQLTIVTQAFHLPRALYLCNTFKIEANGVLADDVNYPRRSYNFWWFREVLASVNAYWDLYIAHPQPILGESISIFPD